MQYYGVRRRSANQGGRRRTRRYRSSAGRPLQTSACVWSPRPRHMLAASWVAVATNLSTAERSSDASYQPDDTLPAPAPVINQRTLQTPRPTAVLTGINRAATVSRVVVRSPVRSVDKSTDNTVRRAARARAHNDRRRVVGRQ